MMPPGPVQASNGDLPSRPLSLSGILSRVLVMAPLFFMNRYGLPGNLAFCGIAVLLMLKGRTGVAQAVSLLALVITGNVAFVTRDASLFGVMKFGVLLIGFINLLVVLRREGVSLQQRRPFMALVTFVGVVIVLALFIDAHPLVSVTKVVAFGVGFTLFFSLCELAAKRQDDMADWFVPFIAFAVAASVLALGLGVGFNSKLGTRFAFRLFNGVFYHPQTCGPACSLMIIYLVCLMLYSSHRILWVARGLVLVLMVFLFLSSSRTGVVTLVVGLVVAFSYWLIQHRGRDLALLTRMSGHWMEMAVIACCLGLVVTDMATDGRVRNRAAAFVNKTVDRSRYSELEWDRVLYSRKGQIEKLVDNISEHPWCGIGFGISTSRGFEQRVSLFSAPTEKGFLPLAIVEETGTIGAAFFFVFIVSFYQYLFKQRNGPGLAMFSALLGANLGEMMFFSFGGHGLLMWVLVGGGLALGAGRPVGVPASTSGDALT